MCNLQLYLSSSVGWERMGILQLLSEVMSSALQELQDRAWDISEQLQPGASCAT